MVIGSLAWLAGPVAPVRAQSTPEAVIEAEVDPSAHNYRWSVRNLRSSPIVEVAIPHFRGDLFHTPPDWDQDCTYLMNVGVPNLPGVCRAMAKTARDGILSGRAAEFQLRIAGKGASQGTGSITLRWADGYQANISDVLLPVMPSASETFVPLVGLGSALFLLLILQRVRSSRQAADSSTGAKG